MFSSTQKKKCQSSYVWFKRNDSIVLLDNYENCQFYQILSNLYIQNINSFVEMHKDCLEEVQNYHRIGRQNYSEKIGLKKLEEIYKQNEFKMSKEILHRNQNIRKSMQSYASIFPWPLSPPQQKPLRKNQIKSKPELPNKAHTNKQIVIINQGFKKQHNRMSHIDKIYSSITADTFSKNQVVYTEESKPHPFLYEKDRYVMVPNRIKMAKMASRNKKTDLYKKNIQEQNGLIKKQKTDKVSLSLGDQIMNKFGSSRNKIRFQFSPTSTKRCLNEITRLKQKMEENKSKQNQIYNSISKANIPHSVFAAQCQGYRPKNRYFDTIFQLNRKRY